MNKELKAKLKKRSKEMRAAFPNLYDQRWVERAADKGWKNVVNGLDEVQPGFKRVMNERIVSIFEVVYYSAFEDALNTFFAQCLEDSSTEVQLQLDKLHKITAEIKEKE